MTDLARLQAGDKVMVYGMPSFLARSITFFMRRYQKRIGFTARHDYHHTGTIIELWGVLHVAEAVGKGYVIHKLHEAYTPREWAENVDCYTWTIPLTDEEKKAICKKAVELSTRVTFYDFANFFYQIKKVFGGGWTGPIGSSAEKSLYCSEADATVCNAARVGTYVQPWEVNPIDSVNCKEFRLIV